METYKFTCECCNFKCNYNSGWLDHLSSNKHLRQGKPTTYICNFGDCNHVSLTHWNLKIHKINNHSTKEERELSKYYCKDCDQVFFSPLYFDKHNNGKKHMNQAKVNLLNKHLINLNP